jgi:hypothetical protein
LTIFLYHFIAVISVLPRRPLFLWFLFFHSVPLVIGPLELPNC